MSIKMQRHDIPVPFHLLLFIFSLLLLPNLAFAWNFRFIRHDGNGDLIPNDRHNDVVEYPRECRGTKNHETKGTLKKYVTGLEVANPFYRTRSGMVNYQGPPASYLAFYSTHDCRNQPYFIVKYYQKTGTRQTINFREIQEVTGKDKYQIPHGFKEIIPREGDVYYQMDEGSIAYRMSPWNERINVNWRILPNMISVEDDWTSLNGIEREMRGRDLMDERWAGFGNGQPLTAEQKALAENTNDDVGDLQEYNESVRIARTPLLADAIRQQTKNTERLAAKERQRVKEEKMRQLMITMDFADKYHDELKKKKAPAMRAGRRKGSSSRKITIDDADEDEDEGGSGIADIPTGELTSNMLLNHLAEQRALLNSFSAKKTRKDRAAAKTLQRDNEQIPVDPPQAQQEAQQNLMMQLLEMQRMIPGFLPTQYPYIAPKTEPKQEPGVGQMKEEGSDTSSIVEEILKNEPQTGNQNYMPIENPGQSGQNPYWYPHQMAAGQSALAQKTYEDRLMNHILRTAEHLGNRRDIAKVRQEAGVQDPKWMGRFKAAQKVQGGDEDQAKVFEDVGVAAMNKLWFDDFKEIQNLLMNDQLGGQGLPSGLGPFGFPISFIPTGSQFDTGLGQLLMSQRPPPDDGQSNTQDQLQAGTKKEETNIESLGPSMRLSNDPNMKIEVSAFSESDPIEEIEEEDIDGDDGGEDQNYGGGEGYENNNGDDSGGDNGYNQSEDSDGADEEENENGKIEEDGEEDEELKEEEGQEDSDEIEEEYSDPRQRSIAQKVASVADLPAPKEGEIIPSQPSLEYWNQQGYYVPREGESRPEWAYKKEEDEDEVEEEEQGSPFIPKQELPDKTEEQEPILRQPLSRPYPIPKFIPPSDVKLPGVVGSLNRISIPKLDPIVEKPQLDLSNVDLSQFVKIAPGPRQRNKIVEQKPPNPPEQKEGQPKGIQPADYQTVFPPVPEEEDAEYLADLLVALQESNRRARTVEPFLNNLEDAPAENILPEGEVGFEPRPSRKGRTRRKKGQTNPIIALPTGEFKLKRGRPFKKDPNEPEDDNQNLLQDLYNIMREKANVEHLRLGREGGLTLAQLRKGLAMVEANRRYINDQEDVEQIEPTSSQGDELDDGNQD